MNKVARHNKAPVVKFVHYYHLLFTMERQLKLIIVKRISLYFDIFDKKDEIF